MTHASPGDRRLRRVHGASSARDGGSVRGVLQPRASGSVRLLYVGSIFQVCEE